MKSLQKAEMLERDQVHDSHQFPEWTFTDVHNNTVACSCPRGARCSGGINITLGCPVVLFFPGPSLLIPCHGISPWRRSDDNADEIRYVHGRCDTLLHGRVYIGY